MKGGAVVDENEKSDVLDEEAEDTQETAEDEDDEEDDEDEEDSDEKTRISFTDFIEIVESTLITIFVIVMIFTYLLHPVNIVGHSMYPTLNNYPDDKSSDKVFMSTVYFGIDYGDILVIDNHETHLIDDNGQAYVPEDITPLNECIIKRVIATGGQTIDIKDNQVIVDGEVLEEPYIATGSTTYDLGAFDGQYPFTVPEGYYFVMGDNRNHSSDSRDAKVGLVSESQVYGKAIVRYSPIERFHILTNSWKESAND